jgi:uncharacterized protein (TIGR02597 family)
MRKNLFYCFTGIALATGMVSAAAQSASVATVPVGMITCAIPHDSTSYLSLPLTNAAIYTSTVTAVAATTISVGDSPAPFTTDLTTPAAPYFVKFLSGSEMGRVLLITANTASTLTLNITDNSTQTVNLTTSGFSVAAGDTFEIFPAETLASMFGDNSAQNPLVLTGSPRVFSADSVSLYNTSLSRWKAYYFNTTAGYWECFGSTANANNTILYPYGAMTVTRRSGSADTSIVMSGRVAEVPCVIKTTGSSVPVYGSTGYALDMTLSQLQFGSAWVMGTTPLTASTISVWNPALSRFDTYYQKPDSTWRKTYDSTTDQSNFVVGAGTGISILQRGALSGGASFLPSAMPYSLN